LIDATQLHHSDSSGFLRRHAGADVVLDMHLQVTLDLVGEVAIASTFQQHTFQPNEPRTKLSHD
jgi:hypothetical protein